MNVTIFGVGYVGLVTGACLAQVGNRVTCVDIDATRIDDLCNGRCPIFEPGLPELLREGMQNGRLQFTTDSAAALEKAELVMIAVGTPPDEDGSADVRHVLAVARTLGRQLRHTVTVAVKSTVPVGSCDRVVAVIREELDKRGANFPVEVASNPEFLKEGAALKDFNKPDRIVVGSDSSQAQRQFRTLYAPFNRNRDRLMFMSVRSAELTKYAANALLATRISFINEIANIAEHMGADIEEVRQGIGSDPRIGHHFIYPGCGYGGSCFPKDVRALAAAARNSGYRAGLLAEVENVNQRQKRTLFHKLEELFDGDLRGRTIAIWGLAFKPETDDMREAPSRELMEQLWRAGARVRAYDPVAMEQCRRIYGEREPLVLCDSAEKAADGADALAICTEWRCFWAPDFAELKECLRRPLIVDGRNLFQPDYMRDQGFSYHGIGRGESLARRELPRREALSAV
ncbi:MULTISPECIES: UDP-glucose/GDP-mannose dehydrogenase family protein [unclassified Microbulbifer]|uniref:UDP-glucose dehydrogenase family protein n=1 Tax=unclassified Microbulbifer TaxID=2619833 RepID=UPI0027E42139|nr:MULTISPECIES: UDP-glucose/GDP-mannose dehydrogenase family protein [unclassified Microbulbifer]